MKEGENLAACSYKQVYVKCPFYRRDDGSRCLTCEGVVEDSTLKWMFRHKEDLNQQMDIFCCDYYKNCEVYRMLMEAKY